MRIQSVAVILAVAGTLPCAAARHEARMLGEQPGQPTLGASAMYRESATSIVVWRLPDGEQVAFYPRPRPAKGHRAAGFVAAGLPTGQRRLLAWTFDESLSTGTPRSMLARLHAFEAPGEEPGRELFATRLDATLHEAVNLVRAEYSPGERRAVVRIKSPDHVRKSYAFHRLTVDLEAGRVEVASATYAMDARHHAGYAYAYDAEDPIPHSDHAEVKIDDDGRLIALEYENDTAMTVDARTGKRIALLQGVPAKSYRGTWLDGPGHAFELSDADAGRVRLMIWDAMTGRKNVERVLPDSVLKQGLEFAPRKALFLERASSDSVRVWDLASQDEPATIGPLSEVDRWGGFVPGHGRQAQLSDDGSYLVYRSSGRYRVASIDPPITPSYSPAGHASSVAALVNVDDPPVTRTPRAPDAYAVVIGVSKYRSNGIPPVSDALRDARAVYATLTRSMGFDAANTLLLLDGQAGRADLDKSLGPWLRNRVGPRSRVFVYFSGHGAPNPVSGEGYLMPFDGDPNYLAETAYPLTRLYAELAALPTREVTVVLDSCFSGRGDRSLLAAGARPLVVSKPQAAGDNTVVISASASTQISLSHRRARHGLLTYHLLEGLRGPADADGDGQVTAAEAFGYARPAVEREARLQNAEQTPVASPSQERLAATAPWVLLKK
ncbi:MAG: caspase family protein [Elusimicrobiota bacterium]|nr:caspase family protein [Elusimicrobiota bacterium]